MNANVYYHTITCDTKKQVKTDFRANNNESHSNYVHVCACIWPFVRVHTQMHRTVATAHTMTAFYSMHMPARRTAESGPHEYRPRTQDYNWAQKKTNHETGTRLTSLPKKKDASQEHHRQIKLNDSLHTLVNGTATSLSRLLAQDKRCLEDVRHDPSTFVAECVAIQP